MVIELNGHNNHWAITFKVMGGPFKLQPFADYNGHRIPVPKGEYRKVITVLLVRILYVGCSLEPKGMSTAVV
jgi:hypothetical protein